MALGILMQGEFSWRVGIVIALLAGLGLPAAAQSGLNEQCGKRIQRQIGAKRDAVQLIDADCSVLRPLEIGGSATDKNYRSQRMHRVTELRDRGLRGQGITVGIWDAGHVLDRHAELAGRVSFGDANRTMAEPNGAVIAVPLHEHATHVAGTIAANGAVQRLAEGMAPRTRIVSYYWGEPGQDVADLKTAAARGISVTNHSYGVPAGWEFGGEQCAENWTWLGRDNESVDARFGAYDDMARAFDEVIWQNKSLSVFVAAGNERGVFADPEKFRGDPRPTVQFTGGHCVVSEQAWKKSSAARESDLSKGGFDTITGRGLGKNVITIGAAVRLDPPFDNAKIRPTDFSSMGPADDGRIKPDLLANGDDLFSTYLPKRCLRENANACYPKDLTSEELRRYATSPGTSMATPVAAGIAALMNQLSLTGARRRVLYADEMKAALVQTAKSPTKDGKPSYRWGWGLIDAFEAAELVAASKGGLTRHQLVRDGASEIEIKLDWSDRNTPLALTTVWIDEPGEVSAELTIDDRTPKLINRLDVRLISPSSREHHPWSLDPKLPQAEATNEVSNLIDNVQRIDVDRARWEAGTWRLVIKPSRLKAAKLELAVAHNKAAVLRTN